MKAMSWAKAIEMGYAPDKRKRRRQHRRNDRYLSKFGGAICAAVAHWHRCQARLVKKQPKPELMFKGARLTKEEKEWA